LTSQFIDLSVKIRLHNSTEVPKLFSQEELGGLVDKTTAQQTKVQQFETDRRQGKFSVKIP
jgi:hypothetical protein